MPWGFPVSIIADPLGIFFFFTEGFTFLDDVVAFEISDEFGHGVDLSCTETKGVWDSLLHF